MANKTKDDYVKELKIVQEKNDVFVEQEAKMAKLIEMNESLKKSLSVAEKQMGSLSRQHKDTIDKFNQEKNEKVNMQKQLNGNDIGGLILKSDILQLLDKKEEFNVAVSQVNDLIKFKRQSLQEK